MNTACVNCRSAKVIPGSLVCTLQGDTPCRSLQSCPLGLFKPRRRRDLAPAPVIDRRPATKGCSGCGGKSAVNAQADPAELNRILAEGE